MNEVAFSGSGPALSITIKYLSTAGQNINAVYTYRLWEVGSNGIVSKNKGNNMNDQDDIYWLPTPTLSNHGRVIEIFSTLKNNDSNPTPVRVEVEICQGGQRIDLVRDQKQIPANDVGLNQIFITLKAQ